ncbi:MAG: acyl-ACP--UDP-N-acetylglucosamine O-acyltransferase [Desulfarculus sp.]|nr:acyl-ACP--UDP-N-acetylglucosamine O-acyltransferase [Desulfarculus sp.]
MNIHPTAVVDQSARIAPDAVIGPYTFIGPGVSIAAGCRVDHHVNIEKNTTVGEGSHIWPFASLGSDPQDLKFGGEESFLELGRQVQVREFVTVNRGTLHGGGTTRVGDHCMLMAYSHVAHDCQLGDHVIMANAATLAGHVFIEDHVGLGGLVAVHQFTRIGRYCFVGGLSGVSVDLPPYCLCEGNRAKTHGLNIVGLKRAGFGNETLEALKQAYKIVFRTRTPLATALQQVEGEVPDLPEVRHFVEFIRKSERGVAR